jgi:hypothetical protein
MQIHDMLLCALHTKRIDFTSYVSNEVDELPQEFLDEVNDTFGNVQPSERRELLMELASVANITKCHKTIEIVGIRDIKFLRSDIIILTELNEDSWFHTDSGSYWLHSLLRHKTNLPVSANSSAIEDSFYSCFCSDAEIYMLRALKSTGSSKVKSSILAKFEAISKKHNHPLDYIVEPQEASNTLAFAARPLVIRPPHIPPEIRAEDVGLLIRDPQAFYAKNVLNLRPPDSDKERHERLTALKNFMRACFTSEEQTVRWLEKIRTIDLLLYYKCRDIPEWITSHLSDAPIINNIHGAVHIPKLGLTLLGNCDIVKTDGTNTTLIELGIASSPQSTKNIILGLETRVMPLCYIAEKGGFENIQTLIREVQIWSINKPTYRKDDDPIDVTTIYVSSDVIAAFEATLHRVLDAYCDFADSMDCRKSDRYRHLKR